jgi:hypothetical protein
VVLTTVLALATAAGAVVLDGGRRGGHEAERAREFQQLVGGLGFGPAVDLSGNAFRFDPRLSPRRPADLDPLPGGGASPGAQDPCCILYYPSPDPSP